jgi:hypothetical protein
MNPHRVVEQYPLSFEAQLLRAGRAVKAPNATLEVTMSALGLGATAAASASGAAHAKVWSWYGTVSAKWMAVAILAASGAFVATRLHAPSAASVGKTARPSAAPVALADGPERPEWTRAAVTVSKATAPLKATVVETLPPAAPKAARAPHEKPPSGLESADSLGAEVALIDAARRAVDESQGGRALALLRHYDRQFTRPRLAREAALLRARALEQVAHENEAKPASASSSSLSGQNLPGEPQ